MAPEPRNTNIENGEAALDREEYDQAFKFFEAAAEEGCAQGFVLHTLEAALWAVDTTSSVSSAVLKAVNLGDDADSVGAVAGQLAGARYGMSAIPQDWLDVLIHLAEIERIGRTLFNAGKTLEGCDVV